MGMLKTKLIEHYVFSKSFLEIKEKLRLHLSSYKRTYGNIALFGAGHVACTFVNLLGLKEYISFVVDDKKRKAGIINAGF